MEMNLVSMIVIGLLSASATAPSSDRSAIIERDGKISEIVLDHYPRASLKAGEEGIVGFQVTLNKDDKLHSCVVTQSSGYPRLDTATCDMLVATAHFKRAEGEIGRRGPTIHDGTVAWKLPEGLVKAAPPAPPSAQATKVELADTKLICKRTPKVGHLFIKTKLCLTKKDWERARENARRETEEMQRPKGPLQY